MLRETHLGVAVFQCQNSLSNVQSCRLFIKSTKHPQQAEAVSSIYILHHNVQIIPASKAIVESHLQYTLTRLSPDHSRNAALVVNIQQPCLASQVNKLWMVVHCRLANQALTGLLLKVQIQNSTENSRTLGLSIPQKGCLPLLGCCAHFAHSPPCSF